MTEIVQGGTILVVDDNLLNYEVIALALRKQKHTISYAENGLKAIELTQTNTYDLILLDIMMPDLNGYEVCELLKKNPQTNSIPIIFLSALTDSQDKVKAFEYGGVDYITKPISPNELIARVATHIRINKLEKEMLGINKNLEKMVTQSSKNLAESQKEYKLLIENQNDYIIRTNSYDHITFLSPNLLIVLNQDKDSVVNFSFKDLIFKDDRENLPHFRKSLDDAPFKIRFVTRMDTKQGLRWIEWSCKGTPKMTHSYDGFIGVGRDITEQKENEEQLLITQFAVDHTDIALAWLLPDGLLNYLNQSFAKLFLYTAAELDKMFVPELLFNMSRDEWESVLINLRRTHFIHIESIVPLKNGIPIYAELTLNLLTYKHNEYIVIVARNIAERKETERKIFNAILETEERERRIFAEDLHEELEPFLSGIRLFASQLSEPDISPSKKNLLIKNIKEMTNEAFQKTRIISNKLTPVLLRDLGLIKALNSFITKLNIAPELDIVFNTEHFESARLSEGVEIVLYRITLELLNNTLKHASASKIIIDFSIEDNKVLFAYADNGVGFDIKTIQKDKSGIGILTIINRLTAINGSYSFESHSQKGAKFKIIVDLE